MKKQILFLTFISLLLTQAGCQNKINKAVRDTKYSAWEIVGVEKRDLFRREVNNTKKNQEETGEAFKDALTKLKEVYAFDGGKLEKEYRSLNSAYEKADGEAKQVRASIIKVETVAGDLFAEWKKEIAEINSADLRVKSSANLAATQVKYGEMHGSLKKAESKMDPVLAKLKDQVLYLKHNLNAKAVGSLKNESARIEKDIAALIADTELSIKAADEFIKELE